MYTSLKIIDDPSIECATTKKKRSQEGGEHINPSCWKLQDKTRFTFVMGTCPKLSQYTFDMA